MDVYITAPIDNGATIGVIFQFFNAGVYQSQGFILYAPSGGDDFDDIKAAALTGMNTYASAHSYTVSNVSWWFNLPATTSTEGLISAADKTKLNGLSASAYKSYQALVSQSGTSAPTSTDLVNDFGTTTFTWARTGAGVYTVTASSAVFTAGKTGAFVNPLSNLNGAIRAIVTSTTVITITTAIQQLAVLGLLGFTAVNTDAMLSANLLEVRVYP